MNQHYVFVNTPLPYSYDALEPYIDAKTMELHHNRHLQTYIDNLNDLIAPYPKLHNLSLEELIYNADKMPPEIRVGVKNNAGGVYNHLLYFDGLNVNGDRVFDSYKDRIPEFFGSYENFKNEMKKSALSVFGSGYAQLVWGSGGLSITTTANQDTPLSMNLIPVLNIDVWEHAYYLKHYNQRAAYIDDWFEAINLKND